MDPIDQSVDLQSNKNYLQQQLTTYQKESDVLQALMALLENLSVRYNNKMDAFKAFDKNESGAIEQDEFIQLLEENNLNDHKTTELFDKYSENGSISLVSWNDIWDTTQYKFQNLQKRIMILAQKLTMSQAMKQQPEIVRVEESIINNSVEKQRQPDLSEQSAERALDFSLNVNQLQQEVVTLGKESEQLSDLVNLLKNLENLFPSKYDAFKAFDFDTNGALEKAEFIEKLTQLDLADNKTCKQQQQQQQQAELFDKFSVDGKISEGLWSELWLTSGQKFYQIQHRITMINQKLSISEALDKPADHSVRGEDLKIGVRYNSIIDKVKNTSSLGDLSDIFSSLGILSPNRQDRERMNPVPELITTQMHFDTRKTSKFNVAEEFKSYRSSGKKEEQYPEPSSRGSYLPKTFEHQLANSRFTHKQGSSGNGRGSHKGRSKSPPLASIFLPQQESKIQVPNQRISNLSFTYQPTREVERQGTRTNRRKDDLTQFMSKLGIGKIEPLQVQQSFSRIANSFGIALDRPKEGSLKQNVERMRMMISSRDPIANHSHKKSALDSLLTEPKFSISSFRQQRDSVQDPRKRGQSKSLSQGRDAFYLIDQSLKNYTLKLIHKHKYGAEQEEAKTGRYSAQQQGYYQRNL